MKATLILFAALLTFALPSSRAADAPAAQPIRLVIVGDSTACNYPADSVRRGWGMFIQDYFDTNRLRVINLARSGRSTKSFIKEGLWTAALKEKPAFVLIQFGHNDSHSPDKPEATDSKTTYREYLRQYIDESRAIDAQPVLITPMCRRVFGADGRITNDLLPYVEAMKTVAQEKKVPLVDLNAASVELCNQLGPKDSVGLANDPKDQTHFNAHGAKKMARLIMNLLPAAEPRLNQYRTNR